MEKNILVKIWHFIKRPLKVEAVRNIEAKRAGEINPRSNNIVYIGHSYHNKTKSTAFLIDYLKQFYDVEVVLDESWTGKPFPDLSFIDESYLAVVFFENLPSREILENIKNNNLIFFPMYHNVYLDFEFWDKHRNLKVINFSKALHEKQTKWGIDSIYVQYFPEPQEYIAGKKDEAFFWQRLTRVNINTISKLFANKNMKIHIHRAVDPDQEYIKPSHEDEAKFQITYSDWLETRGEVWDLIKEKGIYIAPREFEGIGMSFLEAMSMGKAVVAVDKPTMNEYIEHNKTGYLFDLAKPEEIDLSNVEQVQKGAYKFMCRGYEKWQQNKHNIIDFIRKR